MIDPEIFSSLASYESPSGCAVSFYFSEPRPENLAHRRTVITAKDVLRNLQREQGDPPALREIVQRLESRAEEFRSSHPRGIAVFAAPAEANGDRGEFWRELELPFEVEPQADVGKSFMLAPLVPVAMQQERYFILLLDRSVTRLLSLDGESLAERTKEFGEERIPVRETGTARKKSDERSKDDEAFHHLRHVGERVFKALEQGQADYVYIGCRTELYPEIKAAFPDNLVQKIIGQFPCDPGLIPLPEVQALVQPAVEQRSRNELATLVEQANGAAAAGTRGAVGPQQVVDALEMGEVQTLLIGPHAPRPATVCTSCGHIDLGTSRACSLCGNPVTQYDDLAEVIARRVVTGGFEVATIPADLPIGGDGFVAKLRFRADRSVNQATTQVA